MTDKHENQDQLLSRFYAEADRDQVKEDLAAGDALFEAADSAIPDTNVINSIKLNINKELTQQKSSRNFLKSTISIAASIFIAATLIFMHISSTQPDKSQTAASYHIWEDENDYGQDAVVEAIAVELRNIENDMRIIRLGEVEYDSLNTVNEVEIEIIETNGDFWKG